jgi:hypothetical protein
VALTWTFSFAEESALGPGITRFNGLSMPSGRSLEVKIPDKSKLLRDRSGSQSSQTYSSHSLNHQGRFNHRTVRTNSASSRQHNHPHQIRDPIKSHNNSPEAHKQFSPGFKAHPNGPLPYSVPIPAEQLRSTLSEIMQHQSALERLRFAQVPLEPIEHYSGGNRTSNGPLYEKSGFNKKENSPVKDVSKNTTPEITPKKEQVGIFSGGSNNNGYSGNNEGFKQQHM